MEVPIMSAIQKQEVNFRPMERRDIVPALAMFKKMPDARGTLTHRDLASWRLGKERDASFVAEVDGQIVGLVLARITFVGIPVAEVCSIQVIVVDPDHQRQSIGAGLVNAVVDRCYAEGITTVRAFVDQNNWQLKNFVENMNFKPSGLIAYVKTVEV
jgi:ribosomal protein S18 acetylase RimI-like enzyme